MGRVRLLKGYLKVLREENRESESRRIDRWCVAVCQKISSLLMVARNRERSLERNSERFHGSVWTGILMIMMMVICISRCHCLLSQLLSLLVFSRSDCCTCPLKWSYLLLLKWQALNRRVSVYYFLSGGM